MKAIRMGALDFLQSPITIELLRTRIHYYLQYRSMRKNIEKFAKEVELEALAESRGFEERVSELEKEMDGLKRENLHLKSQIIAEQNNHKETLKKEVEFKKKLSQAFVTPIQSK